MANINVIQEITLQGYAFGIFDILMGEKNMSREEAFSVFQTWADEFEELHKDTDWYNNFYYDEIDAFLARKKGELYCKHKVGEYVRFNGNVYRIREITDGETSDGGYLAVSISNPDDERKTIKIDSFHDAEMEVLSDYEEIMDTNNCHDAKLVAKINNAWNTKREMFCPILCALYKRDNDEILASDAFADWGEVAKDFGTLYEYMEANWGFEAYNYLMHIADDGDLACILLFLGISPYNE